MGERTPNMSVQDFLAETEVVLNAMAPELDYRRSDLSGFVRAAWPYDGTPADAANDWVEALAAQNAAS